jgi:hypothetical protein
MPPRVLVWFDTHLPAVAKPLRVWYVDLLRCPLCQNPRRVIALMDDPRVVQKGLRHLDAWKDPAPRLPPARGAGFRHLRTVRRRGSHARLRRCPCRLKSAASPVWLTTGGAQAPACSDRISALRCALCPNRSGETLRSQRELRQDLPFDARAGSWQGWTMPGEAIGSVRPHPRSVKHMRPEAKQFLILATCPWPLTRHRLKMGSRSRFRSATCTCAASRPRLARTSVGADLATKRQDQDREAMEVVYQGECHG